MIYLDFEHIYKELDIKIIDRGESFYQSRMIDVVKELESKSKMNKYILRKMNSSFFSNRFIEIRRRSSSNVSTWN
jgi:hypothetical protein